MPRLVDSVRFVDPQEYSASLRSQVAMLEAEADRIWPMVQLGEACRVLSSILRCAARQLRILEAGSELPIEVLAGACRTVFEVDIRTRLITSDPVQLHEFLVERLFDELSFLEAAKRLAHDQTSQVALGGVDSRIRDLRDLAQRRNVKRPKNMSWRDRAKAAGVEVDYDSLYGFWCNYVHGTSWLVNNTDEARDCQGYRTIFAVSTQRYAADILARVLEYVGKAPK